LGLFRPFLRLGVHQNDFQRRVLEHALEGLGVNEANRKHGRVQRQRDTERELQGGQGAKRGGDFHGAGGVTLSVSFMSTAMAMGPATASSSPSSSVASSPAPVAWASGLSRRSISVPLTSSVIS